MRLRIFMQSMPAAKPSFASMIYLYSADIFHPELGLVTEWAALHQDELLKAWNDAKSHIKPSKIAPL